MDYLDFVVEIFGDGPEYKVKARWKTGEAEGTFRPFESENAMHDKLKDVRIATLGSRVGVRRIVSGREKPVQEFGSTLFNALFQGWIDSGYRVTQEDAFKEEAGVRVKLIVHPSNLSTLPWEYLYDARQREYVSLMGSTPLVRSMPLAQSIMPLAVKLPLRILGIVSAPRDYEQLDVAKEKGQIEQAVSYLVAKRMVELHWLEGSNWRDLHSRLQMSEKWHVLHFIGHGGFDKNLKEGVLLFTNERGDSDRLYATDFARLVSDHRSLRLVILNACEGAVGGEDDEFSSTASILLQRKVPAVVAMQDAITDIAAKEFARAFYQAIAHGYPVDAAMVEARKAVSLATRGSFEWSTPVLYMNTANGELFRLEALTEEQTKEQEQQAKAERQAQEQEQLAREKEQREATEKAEAERQVQEQDQLAREKEQKEAAEKSEAEQQAQEQEQERLARINEQEEAEEKAEAERLTQIAAAEALLQQREAAERAEAERRAKLLAEKEAARKRREELEKAEAERIAREREAFEKAETERIGREREAKERTEAERLAREQEELTRRKAEKVADLIARGDAALDAERWQEAIALAEELKQFDFNSVDRADLMIEVAQERLAEQMAKQRLQVSQSRDIETSISTVMPSGSGAVISAKNLDKLQVLWEIERNHTGFFSVSFSPNGSLLATGDYDNLVCLWRGANGYMVREFKGPSKVNSVAFSPDGKVLGLGLQFDLVLLRKVTDGSVVRELKGHTSKVNSVAFSPDGNLLASCGDDKLVCLWNLADGSLVRELKEHTDKVHDVAFLPDGSLLASGGSDKRVLFWNVANGGLVRELKGHKSRVQSVAFSSDGSIIASASDDKSVRLWGVSDGRLLRVLIQDRSPVRSVAFSPDGMLIAWGGADKTIRLNARDGTLLKTLEVFPKDVLGVCFSADGTMLAACSGGTDWPGGGMIRVWGIRPVSEIAS